MVSGPAYLLGFFHLPPLPDRARTKSCNDIVCAAARHM
jgi:hypothetical protein